MTALRPLFRLPEHDFSNNSQYISQPLRKQRHFYPDLSFLDDASIYLLVQRWSSKCNCTSPQVEGIGSQVGRQVSQGAQPLLPLRLHGRRAGRQARQDGEGQDEAWEEGGRAEEGALDAGLDQEKEELRQEQGRGRGGGRAGTQFNRIKLPGVFE